MNIFSVPDKSGWQQRASVIENLLSEGHVKIRHKGNEDILLKYPDVRRHMEFMTFDLTPGSAKTSAVRVVQNFLDSLQPKTLTTFGYVGERSDQLRRSSKKWPK